MEKVDVKCLSHGCQNSGNPVLDSFVNLAASMPPTWLTIKHLRDVHVLLLELYAKEPCLQKRPNLKRAPVRKENARNI